MPIILGRSDMGSGAQDSYTLRAVVPDDTDQVHGILARSIMTGTASFSLEPPAPSETRARIERMINQKLPWIVAERDGAILGYALADWFRPRPGYRFTLEDSIYIHEDQRGQGLGSVLLSNVLDKAKERGTKQVIAVIGDVENTASINLHKSCGFMYAGVLKNVGFKFDRWLDTIYMQREL